MSSDLIEVDDATPPEPFGGGAAARPVYFICTDACAANDNLRAAANDNSPAPSMRLLADICEGRGRRPARQAFDAHGLAHLALGVIHGLLAVILLVEGLREALHAACLGGVAIIYIVLSRLGRHG